MRKILFISLATLLVISSAFIPKEIAKENYTLNFKLTGFKENTLFLLINSDLEEQIDSGYLKNGKLQFIGSVIKPSKFFIQTKMNPEHREDFKYAFLWVENKQIDIEADFKDFRYPKITGSPINTIQIQSQRLVKKYDVARDSLLTIFFTDREKNKYVWDIIKKNDQITDSIAKDFVRKNPNNLVALSKLTYMKNSFDKAELKKLYEGMPASLQNTDDGQMISAYLNLKKVPHVGDAFIDVKGKDLNGNEHSLSHVNSKLIFLDFWSAGCGPCRSQNKELITLYKKFKSKGFEVVSFSLDKNIGSWKKASAQDSITWMNISDNKGFNSPSVIEYEVQGIPSSYLINEKGIIIEHFNGFNSDGALSKKIEALLVN